VGMSDFMKAIIRVNGKGRISIPKSMREIERE